MQHSLQTTDCISKSPQRWLTATMLALLVWLGLAMSAQAAITSTFVVGNTCSGPTSTTFTPSGAPIQVTWCVTTTNNATEQLCGHSIKLRSANAGENGRFNITNRVLGPNYPDPNSITNTYPVAVTNPPATRDFGGTFGTVFPLPAEANQLLATFTLAPQANATSASYVISLDSFTGLGVDTDSTCGNAVDFFVPTIGITLNLTTYNVTPSAGANGSISPSTVQSIGHGATTTFTVTPNAGYNASVSGSCGGSLVGTTYTTNAITADCSVIASFTLPASVPDAPVIGTATAGNAQVSVAFTAPGNNGGSVITGYTATCGAQSNSGATSPIVVSGLTNGTAVSCTVIATNAIGNSVASAASNSVTPQAPQTITFNPAPTIAVGGTGTVSATGGTSGEPVVFTSTTTSVCTVSGLNGATVTGLIAGACNIAANQNGTAAFAAAPQVIQSFGIGAASQTIIFGTAPTVVVGGTGTVTAVGGGSNNAVVFTSNTTAVCTIAGAVVTGVTAGTCTIAANQAGNANFNAAPQTTQNFPVQIGFNVVIQGAQEVPMVSTAASGSGSVTVDTVGKFITYNFTMSGLSGAVTGAHFHGPAARGANAGVKLDIGANPNTATIAYLPADEADLLAGLWYVNYHTALNGGGEIRGQLDNLGATYIVNPSAGSNGTISPSTAQAVTNGATSAFTVTPNSGYSASAGGTCTGTLVGTTYTTNAVTGNCTVIASFNLVATVPDAPVIGTAIAGDTTVSVAFIAPGNNGGSAITGYTAACGAQSNTGATSPITVSSLTNGTAVTCSVIATNGIGNSVASAASNSVTPQAPQTITFGAAPTIAVGGAGTVSATGGASGNPVVFTSTTTAVCTVSGTNGSTVTGVTAGTCSIAATQAGRQLQRRAISDAKLYGSGGDTPHQSFHPWTSADR